ncbi:hypothetical protein [Kocuria marina]|uniref:hypothetical protein n=1 Tax=Kocuria marina TaxID=223184 RepID=UPI0022E37104|nr:hypothetical protein [Kocuria marina]
MRKFKGEIILAVSGAVLILCAWASYVSSYWYPDAALSSPAVPFFLLILAGTVFVLCAASGIGKLINKD